MIDQTAQKKLQNKLQEILESPLMARGVGLFDDVVQNIHTEYSENEILSYLDINDIVNCVRVNKNPWYRRMTEELKRRKQCVTIYTWLANQNPSESYWHNGTGTRGRMGHSALRTYDGGVEGKGVYVSFYPGGCGTNDPHYFCQEKNNSHFHTRIHEAGKGAIKTDLYGLDIDSINQNFQALHDNEMNSHKAWQPRYNCSDVVLFLLEKGNLFEKINIRRYGHKTILIIGILNGIFGARLTRSFFTALITMFRWRSRDDYDVDNYTNWPLHHLCGFMFSIAMMYLYSVASYSKTSLPMKHYHSTSIIDAIKAGMIGGIAVPVLELIGIKNFSFVRDFSYYLDNLSDTVIDFCAKGFVIKCVERIAVIIKIYEEAGGFQETMRTFILSFIIFLFPLFVASISLLPKYFFDTTTTPKYILDIVQPIENELKKKQQKENLSKNQASTLVSFSNSIVAQNSLHFVPILPDKQSIISNQLGETTVEAKKQIIQKSNENYIDKLYKNRYKIGFAGLIAIGGFFAVKYANSLQEPIQRTLETGLVSTRGIGLT